MPFQKVMSFKDSRDSSNSKICHLYYSSIAKVVNVWSNPASIWQLL